MAFDALSAFGSADNAFVAARMKAAPTPASGNIVLVGIDRPSLDALEAAGRGASMPTWCGWAMAEGAREIFLDLDFSSPSTPEADAELTAAFAEAGGSIILPAFRGAPGFEGIEPGGSLPLPEFRQSAWIAAVNASPYATVCCGAIPMAR